MSGKKIDLPQSIHFLLVLQIIFFDIWTGFAVFPGTQWFRKTLNP